MSPTSPQYRGVAGLSTPPAGPRAHPSDRTALRGGPRSEQPVLTRRYEFQWLDSDGLVHDGIRVAPATPAFEDAFAAFGRGTLIATENGPIAVEDLSPGVRVETTDGDSACLMWVGSMTLIPAMEDVNINVGEPARLTRLAADTFGADRPGPDLLLGPRARLLYQHPRCREILGTAKAFAPARAFVDGVNVVDITPATPVRVYHLALDAQKAIFANGLAVESYHPGLQAEAMMSREMLNVFLSMFPYMSTLDGFGPMPIPRLTAFELETVRSG